MNLNKIIVELKTELAAINDVLSVLDRLARVRGKRRGRPPLLMLQDGVTGIRKRRPFSEETKRKMAAAQKRRWAAYRKAKKAESE